MMNKLKMHPNVIPKFKKLGHTFLPKWMQKIGPNECQTAEILPLYCRHIYRFTDKWGPKIQ